MTTKERIELEALNLFCIHGYYGVSIRNIAGKVGIKESSIYKHYKGKEEIFDTIREHYILKSDAIFGEMTKNPSVFIGMEKENLIQLVKTVFLTFMQDEYIQKCRKLFMISAPGNDAIGKLYAYHFITASIQFNTQVFTEILQTAGKSGYDAETMAYQFYSPVFCIMQECDYSIVTIEEALQKIEKITVNFMEVYRL